MREGRPSRTAEDVCAWRALERLLPAPERIVDDPFAAAFLGPRRAPVVAACAALPERVRRAAVRTHDRALQGVVGAVLARHRLIDERVVARPDLAQVVLLGAGYDARGVRLEPALRGRRLFEVDHPATAARRAELAPAAFGDAPRAPATSVTVDFARERAADRLLAAGLDPTAPTLWVWEGVSMYLDEPAVAATFDLVATRSPPGSLLVFDLFGPESAPWRRLLVREVPSAWLGLWHGEAFRWGPTIDAASGLLRAHGLEPIEALDLVEAARRLRGPGFGRFPLAPRMALLAAEVRR